MKNQIFRILGGSLIALMLLASTAHGAAVTISISGITNHLASPLPTGSFVQVIQSSDATKGAPGTNGLPAGDTVVANSAMTGTGTFSGGASITANNFIYIRAWEGWNGTGNPSVGAYYGDSNPGNVGSGFVYTYTPAGFSTNQPFGVASSPNITTTTLPAGTVSTAYSQTVAATGGTTPYSWSISAGSLPTGLAINASTGAISGTPTVANTYNFTVRVQDAASASDTQALSIIINPSGGTAPSVSGIAPASAYVGQTIVISGSNFGATKGTSTVTIGGVAANPTAWSATSITTAIPSGISGGAVVITTSGGAGNSSVTISSGGAVIDDVEGGSVGTWGSAQGLADSGYFAFGTGITPDNSTISTNGPQAAALRHGARGMQVRYSYVSSWGGGWGAKLANALDLSAYSTISFYINWDGSSNDLKFSLKDSDGTAYAATIANAQLQGVGAYGQITLNTSALSYDAAGSDAGSNATFDWTHVANYSISYPTTGTTASNQYIDSLAAGTVDFGGGPIITGEVVVNQVIPAVGPAGAHFSAIGTGFGASQGISSLVFENNTTHVLYESDILYWSNTSIEAVVPRLAPTGSYTLKAIKRSISAGGNMQAFESNPRSFQVTANNTGSGLATVYPNPFNPLSTQLVSGLSVNAATIAYDATGIQNVGIYIYDSTARLVYHTTTTASQVSWNGKDDGGAYVADGVYMLRVINEDTKSLIAKAKLIVLKK